METAIDNTDFLTKEEMLNKAGLNWKVQIQKVKTESDIIIPKRISLVREDTQRVLGIHTNTYVPYQNDELLELLFHISKQTGLELHSGGCFKGGELVWFQLKSKLLKIGSDSVQGFISGFNSFNGRTSLALGNTNLTISCLNSFWRGYDSVETRMRHSITMRPKIEEILKKIDLLILEEEHQFKEIQMLGDTKMTSSLRELVTRTLFEIDVTERLDSPDFSTNKKNKMIKFNADLQTELANKGDNLWGLFSGVTRYTTHSMKKGDNTESKIFGRTGSIERKIYRELIETI